MSLDDVPEQIGPYRLTKKIGAGGMGVVYEAIDTLLERPVAIKMMHGLHQDGDDADELRSRFLLEARTAARIKSRHVVQILQLGILPPATIYIVMELLDGTSLKAELKRVGAMPVTRAVRIASEIAEAMALAHELGVVHRDLKPANVMLVSEGQAVDVVKVLDFGIAKLTTNTGKALTQAGVVLGTLAFMAPEQIDSRPLDGRTDIYALGMVLYRMLTGLPAFETENAAELVHLQRAVMPKAPSKRAPGRNIPAALDDVVMRCLEKRQDDRPSSMLALIEALRPFALQPLGAAQATEIFERPSDATIEQSSPSDDDEHQTAITSAHAASAVFTADGIAPVASPLSVAATIVSSKSAEASRSTDPSTPHISSDGDDDGDGGRGDGDDDGTLETPGRRPQPSVESLTTQQAPPAATTVSPSALPGASTASGRAVAEGPKVAAPLAGVLHPEPPAGVPQRRRSAPMMAAGVAVAGLIAVLAWRFATPTPTTTTTTTTTPLTTVIDAGVVADVAGTIVDAKGNPGAGAATALVGDASAGHDGGPAADAGVAAVSVHRDGADGVAAVNVPSDGADATVVPPLPLGATGEGPDVAMPTPDGPEPPPPVPVLRPKKKPKPKPLPKPPPLPGFEHVHTGGPR